ncbi:MAG TPA: class II glutamine amidotransferase [Gammaproteobacteria bacterium]
MCRFTLYLGPPIRLESLLIEPAHSLIRQSAQSQEREEPLNGDGFGVGWYATHFTNEPAVFRSITPAWNNRNLHNLARVIASDCILAHVRAATQSSGVNEANCHPFRYQQYLFMHNGDIGNFRKVRRRLMDSVCDEAFGNVYGSTDSEHFFAVFIDEILRGGHAGDPAERMAAALDRTIGRVIEIVAQHGGAEPSYLNCAVSDGDHAVVSRFTNDTQHPPETLYWFTGDLYPRVEFDETREPGASQRSVIISSERLTPDPGWESIPPNFMVVLRRNGNPDLVPCARASRFAN